MKKADDEMKLVQKLFSNKRNGKFASKNFKSLICSICDVMLNKRNNFVASQTLKVVHENKNKVV